ncbi:MAG: Type III pantothenate kinase [Elusimicrobia bacterium]|nr:Type III pantothenate kinase [Elusimicrobiota bacterium]
MKTPPLLVIDVGNTATSFGLFALGNRELNPHPRFVWTIGTDQLKKRRGVSRFIRQQLNRNKISANLIKGGIVSSVVPSVNSYLMREVRLVIGKNPLFVSYRSPSKIKIGYKNPKEVGADRLVNSRAALALWKGPSIVIDFGTATTFDCVTAKGVYLGGVIAPGPVISAEALYERTAKLPHVILKKSAGILGRNTLESIRAGLYHGYRGLVKEIVLNLKRRMGPATHVFATGGQAHWILKGVGCVDRMVPHLTLLGLYHLWQDSQKTDAQLIT